MKIKIMSVVLFVTISLKPALSANNAETPQIPINFLNSLNVNHEKNSDSNNLKVNVLKFYAQIAGFINVRDKINYKDMEFKKGLYTARKNELAKAQDDFIKNDKLSNVFNNTNKSLAQIKEEEKRHDAIIKEYDDKIQECNTELANIDKAKEEADVTNNDKSDKSTNRLWIIPIEIYMNQRIKEEATPAYIVKYFNADFMNPVGGLISGQIYTKFYPSINSSDTRYWTIKPFINSSWSRINDVNNNKTYNTGIGRIGVMVSFIAPLLNEDKTSDAGTIKISGGVLGARYLFGKRNVKLIYNLTNEEKPGRNQIMLCAGAQANITNYFSVSCEFIKSVWATKHRKMNNSISVSLTAAKI